MSYLKTALFDDLLLSLARQRTPLLVVFVLTLLAKAGALLPGYSIDDYAPAADGPGGLLLDVLSKGRAGHWLFLKGAVALQTEPSTARILFVSLGIAAYAIFGLAVVRFWGVRGNGLLPVAAACIIANHPYTCEIFTFRIGLPLAVFVIALLSLILYLACQPRVSLALGAALFAAAMSFYQIVLHFALMVALTGFAIWACRHLLARAASSPNEATPPSWDTGRFSTDRNVRLCGGILLGGFLYILAGVLFGRMMGVSASYFEVLPLDRIPARLGQAAMSAVNTFVKANVLVPLTVRIAFGLILGGLMLGLFRLAARRPVRGASILLAAAVVTLLASAFLWSIGVFLFISGYWPVPRSMAHVSVFWAGCFVAAMLTARSRWAKAGLYGAAAVILFSFIGVSQHIFEEQRRLNAQDMFEANRMVARLEALPGFERVRRVAFCGGRVGHPAGLPRTMWGDMNISAFGASWSQVALLRETSGYDLKWSTDPQEKAAADAYCAEAEPWPAVSAVTLRGDAAFICLGPPKAQ